MSVIVPPLTNNHHHHHPSSYYPTMNTHSSHRRLHGTHTSGKSNQSPIKPVENDADSDHVPFGVVNSMKQRLLNKVNESFLLNHTSTMTRASLSKPSSRLSSNENLLQTKTLPSPLKHTTRLSRSQDNLSHNHSVPSHPIIAEPFTSYLQPKQDVIIVDTTTINHQHSQENGLGGSTGAFDHDDDGEDDLDEGKLRPGHKTSAHRQSYTELHRDEAPKPGTVTTVKNMFERQIRLSRYDADKLFTATAPAGPRLSSQHRDASSPARSRSMSPNDMALRQRRTNVSGPSVPLISTALSLPVPTSYPDLVISHTPPTEPSKSVNEPALLHTHVENLPSHNQGMPKEKKSFAPMRNTIPHEQHVPLTVIVDESSSSPTHHQRPNLLLPSTLSEAVDSQPLDFKSRLALFNRTNTQVSNENVVPVTTPTTPIAMTATKKPVAPTNAPLPNYLTKPSVHHPPRPVVEERKETQPEPVTNTPLPMSMSRSVVNTAKAVTFFGGSKLNSNTKSSLPNSIPAPPVPLTTNGKHESVSMDLFRAPDIIGGNIKLTKSSIFSGARKSGRVQFIDNVDTFEYPSFEVTMAELGSAGSEDERNPMDDDDDEPSSSSGGSNADDHIQLKKLANAKFSDLTNTHEDVDDDELERLARINAKFNSSNLTEKPLKPKGTLHTFRPTHLDQYELGTQHGSLFTSKPSDISSPTNSYSILARQKLLASSDTSLKNFTHHSSVKQHPLGQSKSNFDLANNIQWSSMSTTTDLLF